ncbi:hypothetical protein [Psychrobacter urativorans]|uniref:hypothetical protein n=1 Tax=Psychrobacter urativorans TaxID=45610 RepID=UPI001D0FD4A7|nr:hypothetical protein [Psychrobacter urativorans]
MSYHLPSIPIRKFASAIIKGNMVHRAVAISAVIGTSVMVSACQKTPEPETDAQVETDIQSTPITTNTSDGNNETTEVEVINVQDSTVETEREGNLADFENNIGAEGVTPNAETTTPSPEQAIKGVQVTDVRYRNAAGETLTVVFETSATGVLNAIVTLSNNKKMTLSAPEGQGNNPTYRSTDGNIELVSHGGGNSIDLMQNNKVTSFDAVSAEAEVVTRP